MTETSKSQLQVPQSREQSREATSRSSSRHSTGSRKGGGGGGGGGRTGSRTSRRKSGPPGTGHGRRSSTQQKEISDDDESYSEALNEWGFPNYVQLEIHNFVYSSEVQTAMQRLRERRQRKNKFRKNETHIFHLPKIVNSGTLPFVPSAGFIKQTEEAKLPLPKAVDRLPRLRRRTRQSTLLMDTTLENVQEEGRRIRRQTPLSRSFTKSFSKTTPKGTPVTTPRAGSQRTTPKLVTPRMTPKSTPTTKASR